jgi:phage recombination protein Bet
MAEAAPVATIATAKNSVLVRMAERFGVDPNKLHATLKATAFRGEVSNEQFMALMIVADQYKLNPLLREIYAFPDRNNGIVPVVGIDGWARIINEHPQCNGIEFLEGPTDHNSVPDWIECVIYRKDREHPTRVREYFVECKRATPPWGSHPRRMLRHKALIQCARLAFGFVGIYDDDEAQRIIEGGVTLVPESSETVSKLNAEITGSNVIDAEGTTTYAAVMDAINACKTADECDLAEGLIQGVANEGQRAELDVALRAKRKTLAK